MYSTRGDRGQALPLLLAVVVMAALGVAAIGMFSVRIIDRGRAQTAADAAALAAVTGGRPVAQQLATANGARLISYLQVGNAVTVVVEVDGQRATARATDGP